MNKINHMPIGRTFDGKPLYDNAHTVVVVGLMSHDGMMIAIRRNLPDGKDKLALVGGYQMRGETWDQAGAREVKEEIGLDIDPEVINFFGIGTASNGVNLLFATYPYPVDFGDCKIDPAEVSEVVEVTNDLDYPSLWAFPKHYEMFQMMEHHLLERM